MKRLRGLFAIALLGLVSVLLVIPAVAADVAAPVAPLLRASGKPIAGRYIVVFKPGSVAQKMAALSGVAPRYVYDSVLNGFAADLAPAQLSALRRNPNVAYIEEDQEISINSEAAGPLLSVPAATQTNPPWGLDRIDQRNLPLSGTYTYNKNGAGIRAYIIDTGIQTSHPQFGGRAAVAFDALGGNGQDCNGHGTHVAGIVGAATYGVAKGVLLRAVRVLNCSGSGSISGVIAGVNWVANNHAKPAVANMSLGGSFSASLNSAVTNMVNAGVFTSVVAGSSNANACNFSPASATGVLTVAASDRNDNRASFTNFGSCVEIYAPGVSIPSTWLNGGTTTISGTSMATAHACGVGALYKANFGDAPSAAVVNWIVTNATAGVIKGNPAGTPNRLLYKANL